MGNVKSPSPPPTRSFFQGKFGFDGEGFFFFFPGDFSHGFQNTGRIINIPEVEKVIFNI